MYSRPREAAVWVVFDITIGLSTRAKENLHFLHFHKGADPLITTTRTMRRPQVAECRPPKNKKKNTQITSLIRTKLIKHTKLSFSDRIG